LRTIISIVGARPQFIKHAPMQIELEKHFNALTIHTGQHYDKNMSDIFFNELKIPLPDFKLDLKAGLPQAEQTALMMIEIEKIFFSNDPDAILVYGDTNSTLAAVIVAAKLNIPIIHVEAGLRSFNLNMPEEVNRIIADKFSQLLFCPNQEAKLNLIKEGINHEGVFVCGDVMCDMLKIVQDKLIKKTKTSYLFVTIHRPYNTDNNDRILYLLDVLNRIGKSIIFPIHPRTLNRLTSYGFSEELYSNIHFIDPVSYIESLSYQKYSDCVITDSGGIQKEAYMLKKLCITIRTETEWTETLIGGWNNLIFEDLDKIPEILETKPTNHINDLFGNGHASKFIVDSIRNKFN
jgi:UDP-GlcNAc3NAcA epimerase